MSDPVDDLFDREMDDGLWYFVDCKFCGERGLHWEMVDDKWRLIDEEENIHQCEAAQQRSTPQEDFTT